MASLLPPTSPPLPKRHYFPSSCAYNSVSHLHLAATKPNKRLKSKCNAFPNDLLFDALSSLESSPLLPFLKESISQFEGVASGLTENERLEAFLFVVPTWIYLTARPGVLLGAIDAYIFAPLQLGLDSLLGRRNLTMSNFVVGQKLGEGSFGIVYAGAIVPKNVNVEQRGKNKGRIDGRFKDKVILKKVKVGTRGAEECGDFEEWFNYRVSRAAPESCAEFLGSFVADKTSSEFTKGGKWLVWKFEVQIPT